MIVIRVSRDVNECVLTDGIMCVMVFELRFNRSSCVIKSQLAFFVFYCTLSDMLAAAVNNIYASVAECCCSFCICVYAEKFFMLIVVCSADDIVFRRFLFSDLECGYGSHLKGSVTIRVFILNLPEDFTFAIPTYYYFQFLFNRPFIQVWRNSPTSELL